LRNTQWDTGLDLGLLSQIAKYFNNIRGKYLQYETSFTNTDINVLCYQLPGGMISNLEEQLKELRAINRLDEVIAEVPLVRKDLGYPPLVTPTSQIVGSQALLNVLMEARYKVITKEVRNYVRGEYGSPPAAVDPDLKKRVETEAPGKSEPLLSLRQIRETLPDIGVDTRTALSYILFPNETLQFLRSKRGELSTKDKTRLVAAISYSVIKGRGV